MLRGVRGKRPLQRSREAGWAELGFKARHFRQNIQAPLKWAWRAGRIGASGAANGKCPFERLSVAPARRHLVGARPRLKRGGAPLQ